MSGRSCRVCNQELPSLFKLGCLSVSTPSMPACPPRFWRRLKANQIKRHARLRQASPTAPLRMCGWAFTFPESFMMSPALVSSTTISHSVLAACECHFQLVRIKIVPALPALPFNSVASAMLASAYFFCVACNCKCELFSSPYKDVRSPGKSREP